MLASATSATAAQRCVSEDERGTASSSGGGCCCSGSSAGGGLCPCSSSSSRTAMYGRCEPVDVPTQVVGKPLAEPEAALALGALPPRGGNLLHRQAANLGLDPELEGELEATLALDRHRLQELAIVELEAVGGVVDRHPSNGVQAQPCRLAEERLERRAALLPAAAHVPAGGDHGGAGLRAPRHLV